MTTTLPLGLAIAATLWCSSASVLYAQSGNSSSYATGLSTAQDPTDIYLKAFSLVSNGLAAAEKQDYVQAINLTRQAEEILAGLSKRYPQWRPGLLKKRRQINRENMENWKQLAQKQAAERPEASIDPEIPGGKRPLPKPNIALPPGYQGVDFSSSGNQKRPSRPSAPADPIISAIPEITTSSQLPQNVESSYERLRKDLEKTRLENKALIQALKTTRREQEDLLAKLAQANTGESVYRDELIKVKKQLAQERSTNNSVVKTLTKRVEELEQQVSALTAEKTAYLEKIAVLQEQLQQQQEELSRIADERNNLEQERNQLAALVELNSPDKTRNLMDRNMTLVTQLKAAQDRIAELETAQADSIEQQKINLQALDDARAEAVDLKNRLIAIRDENIGYRKRISELSTKLINADIELSKLESAPEKSPLLEEEHKLLRSTIAKQLRVISVQKQSRSMLIEAYKRIQKENPETKQIAALLENEETLKLTPAEQEIADAISAEVHLETTLSDKQQAQIDQLAETLTAEHAKAEQLSKELEEAKAAVKEGKSKSSKKDKQHAEALAKVQEALNKKTEQIEDLSRQLEDMKRRFEEQARLEKIANDKLSQQQSQKIDRNIEEATRKKLEADALAQGAADAFSKKRFTAAEQLYRTLLDRQPTHVPALVNLGTILIQRNKADDAVQVLKKATDLDPKSAPAWFMMGIAQYRAGEDRQALYSLTEAVKLNPANAQALMYMGNLESSAGHHDKAATHFENVLKIQPKSSDAFFNLAFTYSQLGRRKDAEKCYDQAIRLGGLPDRELEAIITGKIPGAEVPENSSELIPAGDEIPAEVAERDADAPPASSPEHQEDTSKDEKNDRKVVPSPQQETTSSPDKAAKAQPLKSATPTTLVTPSNSKELPKSQQVERKTRFRIGS